HTRSTPPYSPLCRSSIPHHRDPLSFPTRRSSDLAARLQDLAGLARHAHQHLAFLKRQGERLLAIDMLAGPHGRDGDQGVPVVRRSEEHTSELQSRSDLVCRLLLEKKKREKASFST